MAHELTEHVGERDETIKELREEGEKLSRQQLQQNNLIKKLRAKEKESDLSMKSLRYISLKWNFLTMELFCKGCSMWCF